MYIAELRRLAARCGFPRDHLLLDRFVCGLRSEKQLLAEKELTLASALEKAQNLEAAHCNAQLLKGHTPTLTVGKVTDHKFPRGRTRTKSHEHCGRRSPCHRCGKSGHRPQECNFRDAESVMPTLTHCARETHAVVDSRIRRELKSHARCAYVRNDFAAARPLFNP